MVFSQIAVTAYACPVLGPAAPVAMPHAAMSADAGETPCAGMDGTPPSPKANACEVHCNDGVTLPAQADLPQIALAALPAPAIALAKLAMADEVARTPLAALPGAPPLTLQFCRLLI